MSQQKKRRRKPKQSSSKGGGTFKITMQSMAYGGSGLGKHNRRTVFIPYTIPGETLQARILRETQRIDFGEGIKLLDASADRVFPRCRHFGPGHCWGCQWQHISYEAQLLLKQDVLGDQLSRIGNIKDHIIESAWQPVLPSPSQWGYNYHMTFYPDDKGRLGFPRQNASLVEAIHECHILHPDLLHLYETLDIDFPDIKSLKLQLGSRGETMMVLTMTSENAPELAADFPTSVNIILPDNEPANLVGDTYVTYTVGERDFRVTAGCYFRPNVPQIDTLIMEILSSAQIKSNDIVLDLYAGVGIFSAFLAPRAALITMVESYPPAATDAEVNLADFDNVDIVEGGVEDVLNDLLADGAYANIAVVDPPGSGLSKSIIDQLTQLGIKRMIYISSNPASLAKDTATLLKGDYHLRRLQPIDFAPQTYYIDTVAVFEKASR